MPPPVKLHCIHRRPYRHNERLRFHPTDVYLSSASTDQTLRLWGRRPLANRATLTGHTDPWAGAAPSRPDDASSSPPAMTGRCVYGM